MLQGLVLLLLLLVIFRLIDQNQQHTGEYNRREGYLAKKEYLEQLHTDIRVAESGVRGFALTGNKDFVKDFDSLVSRIEGHTIQMQSRDLVADSRMDLLLRLDSLVTLRLNQLVITKELTEINKEHAAEVVAPGAGLQVTEAIRATSLAIIQENQDKIRASESVYSKVIKNSSLLTYISLSSAFLLLAFTFFLLNREIRIAKKMSRELRKQKDYMEITLSGISDGLITADTAGRLVYMNQAAERMTGWKRERASGQPVNDVYTIKHEEHQLAPETVLNRVLRTGLAVERENHTLLCSDNKEWLTISNSGIPLYDDAGRLTGAVLTFSDETESRKKEIRIKESEDRYRMLVEEASEAIFISDENGKMLEVNSQAVQLLGYSREEILQMRVRDLLTVQEWANNPTPFELMKKGQRVFYEHKLRHRNGTEIHTELSARMMTDGRFMAIAKDLTHLKKTQKELKDYKSALDMSAIVAVTDTDGIITHVNDYFCRVSGYTREELIGQTHRLINSGYHPDSYFKIFWDTISAGKVWKGELRNKTRDGRFYWVDATVIPFLDEKGKPHQYVAVRHDITKRKEAELAMQETLQRYDILTRATSDTIWDWDMVKDRIVYNEGISTVFGYALSEVPGTTEWWKKNIHPDDRLQVFEVMDQAFAAGRQFIEMEYRYCGADGSCKFIMDRAAILYDEAGKPKRMIGAMQDITYRKEETMRIDRAVLTAQEEERKMIGMELHDNVNQLLSASLLYLSLTSQENGDESLKEKAIALGKDHISKAILEIRTLSHQLAPVSHKQISLKEAIAALLSSAESSKDYRAELRIKCKEGQRLRNELEINLYRIVQEQLTNINKYAQAKKVLVDLRVEEERVRLWIRDDGIGFDTRVSRKGIGLENIRRRAHLFGGMAEVHSAPGKGCEVVVELPLKN